ncbi:MAG: hypothetical protein KJ015_37595 [Myxococcales bacterium]|nr:hypothetical protein [Myxococcales bacterium]
MRDAIELNSRGLHPLAMYAAGLAAECMLRAYHAPDQPLDERHDVVELLRGCELDRLGDAARGRLRGPVQTVHLLWHSLYRFADETWVRAHIKRTGAACTKTLTS